MARALYIHWPFCLRRCPYCDFNSHVRQEVDIEHWKNTFFRELTFEQPHGEPLRSIFFGGGTPSLMPPALVGALLEEAERLYGFTSDIEITLEANPSSVEAGKFAALAAVGINRVSLGIQALNDADLRFLGRLHSAKDAQTALMIAQKCFNRVSIDLIYARPGQAQADWERELGRALQFGTDHLSLYQLTIEPGTRFATDVRRGAFTPLADDPAADLFALTRSMTAAAGRPAYEISNHAAPGQESRHNLAYWRYEDYLGIGPGAHGRRGGVATRRHKKPENWLAAVAEHGHGVAEQYVLGPSALASEALLMGLRLNEGIDLAALAHRFELRTGEMIDQRRLALHQSLGLVWQEGSRIGITEAGMPLLDALLGELVSDTLVAA
ncbi:radical SAM family heme chaperone HemW [Qipengyuania sp. YIM B01966]|uniref:radical SAM family heme chaperone HemW n=1 Tax=Qipengyuania sp. YIM B01966 TaxID=2778646 RepID=UPI0018F2D665|nr:radical SAM family heme chaperone HemW [Qipengyuania sp. YIM B01966]